MPYLGQGNDCLNRIQRALTFFEKARANGRGVTVTEVARAIASPRSHKGNASAGIKAHSMWGDPYEVCNRSEYWTPLPLAYELEAVWIYGVADLVRFLNGTPVEVVELKHYKSLDRYAVAQASIYAWLIAKLFEILPKTFVLTGWNGKSYTGRVEVQCSVQEIEEKIREALVEISMRATRLNSLKP